MNPPSTLLAEVGRATVQCGIDQLHRIQLGDAFGEAILKLRRGTILTSGIGKSGLVARHTAASLTAIGRKCTYLHPCDAMHGDLGAVDPWSRVLLFSAGGNTSELLELCDSLHRRHCWKIAVTASPDSPLARKCELVLPLGWVLEGDHLATLPSSSSLAMLAVGNAITLTMAYLDRLTLEKLQRNHPAGTIGRKETP